MIDLELERSTTEDSVSDKRTISLTQFVYMIYLLRCMQTVQIVIENEVNSQHIETWAKQLHTYARSSTNKQDLNDQKVEILEYARQEGFTIDEFVQINISSRKRIKQRRIDGLLAKLADSDTLIVTELGRLGRSTSEVVALINELIQRNIRVIVIKQNKEVFK